MPRLACVRIGERGRREQAMDDCRFDNLTRTLARGTSRRSLLKGLAGAVLGGGAMLGGVPSGEAFMCRQPGVLCAKDAQCCSGSCDPVSHRCGGDLPCRSAGHPCEGNQSCCAGLVCQASDPGAALRCTTPCTPTTCAAQGMQCGPVSDGCGGTLQCGDCPSATCSTGSCAQGQCTLTPIAGCCTSDDQCDDGTACTVDTCDPSTNTCTHTPVTCQPSDVCHTASCDPSQGCIQTPVSDGTDCGGGKICQQGACVCPSGTMDCGGICAQCCTPDDCPGTTCSPATCDDGTCGRAPIEGCCTQNSDCGDSDACTTDTCVNNTCQHTPVTCQPSDACHTASCDPSQGCVQASVSDGTSCGTNQVCCQGTCCAAGQPCVQGSCCTPGDFNSLCAPGDFCGPVPDGCGGMFDCGDPCGECTPCDPNSHLCTTAPNGTSCGAVGSGQVCADGSCCTPNCAGRQCGGDGCGGSCGTCASGQHCTASGQCACDSTSCSGCCNGNTCEPGDTATACGSGGGSCQACGNGQTCQNGTCACPTGTCGTDCAQTVCRDGSCKQGGGASCAQDADCCSHACFFKEGTQTTGTCVPEWDCLCSNFNFCSGHGTCTDACTCLCDPPYTGVDCSDLPVATCADYTTCTDCMDHGTDGCVFCSATLSGDGAGAGVCTTVDNCASEILTCGAGGGSSAPAPG